MIKIKIELIEEVGKDLTLQSGDLVQGAMVGFNDNNYYVVVGRGKDKTHRCMPITNIEDYTSAGWNFDWYYKVIGRNGKLLNNPSKIRLEVGGVIGTFVPDKEGN